MARRAAAQETEAPPEADRLAPFPHPRETRRLIGHVAAAEELAADLAAGRLHHGWLVGGPEGIGKATLAYRFATWLLARPEERGASRSLDIAPDAQAARQIRAQSHSGLLVVRRPFDPKTKRHASVVTVDEVRRLRSFLAHTSAGDGWRVVIVDPADDLNPSAANALLKSLEEPPPRTIFLLLAAEPGRLLPTIRSRCRTLNLQPLSREELWEAAGQAMTAADVEPPLAEERERLTVLAGGSVRRFLHLAVSGGLELETAVRHALGLLPKVDWNAVHALADDLSGAANEDRFEQFYELLTGLLARLVRVRGGRDGEPAERELAARLIAEGALATWAELWETICHDKAEAQALNLDRKTLVLGTFARLEAAARR
jgi:DNA polymerase-3 subunit delta'